jgi:hypothetical protein
MPGEPVGVTHAAMRDWLSALPGGIPCSAKMAVVFSTQMKAGASFLSRVLLQCDEYAPLANEVATYSVVALPDGALLVVADVRGALEACATLSEEREQALSDAVSYLADLVDPYVLIVVPVGPESFVVDEHLLDAAKDVVESLQGIISVEWCVVLNRASLHTFRGVDAEGARATVLSWEKDGIDVQDRDGGPVHAAVCLLPDRVAALSSLSPDHVGLRTALLTKLLLREQSAGGDDTADDLQVDHQAPAHSANNYWLELGFARYAAQRRKENAWRESDTAATKKK